MNPDYTVKLLSERAVVLQFSDRLDMAINQQVIALHEALQQNPFTGYVESVPGYASLGVFFNAEEINTSLEDCFETVKENIHTAFSKIQSTQQPERSIIEIPVRYGGEYGADIEFVALQNNISVEEVIAIHSEKIYTVFMLGFMPGFPYMGITDERITVERKTTPRLHVPAGSVGLAGNQTGIYPADSPGGWQIIGKTDIPLFDANKTPPCFLKAGDQVRFVPDYFK